MFIMPHSEQNLVKLLSRVVIASKRLDDLNYLSAAPSLIECLKILTIPTSCFIIMLNWLSYLDLRSSDYQRLDCMDGARFL